MGNPTAPGDEFAAITNNVPFALCRGIWVGVSGDIQALCPVTGVNELFKGAVAGTTVPIRTTLIVSTLTTATNLVAIR